MSYFDTQFVLAETDVVGFTQEQRTAVELGLYVSIANEATWLYKNVKHPRYKNFYGYAQVMSGAFVVEDIPLSFLNQEIVHWRDETFGINETTGCYAKAIAFALPTPNVLTTNTVKVRQRYTSVRFRLLPGVVANCSIVWETANAKCGGNVLEPDDKQGQPALPNNSGASPNPRPPGQSGDGTDPSANDGNYDPNGGNPPPPSAGGGAGTGSWKVKVAAYDYNDRPYAYTKDTLITDRFATVTASTTSTGGAPNTAGKPDNRLILTINGVATPQQDTGFGMNVFTPYYF